MARVPRKTARADCTTTRVPWGRRIRRLGRSNSRHRRVRVDVRVDVDAADCGNAGDDAVGGRGWRRRLRW